MDPSVPLVPENQDSGLMLFLSILSGILEKKREDILHIITARSS